MPPSPFYDKGRLNQTILSDDLYSITELIHAHPSDYIIPDPCRRSLHAYRVPIGRNFANRYQNRHRYRLLDRTAVLQRPLSIASAVQTPSWQYAPWLQWLERDGYV
ncbi:hypothetical protein [Neisseria sp. HMSC70E02]|uniref:hypothetical protein n=1 Tax=Neisseria sp. HMSC70E02 TaxID=1608896 RepID=UPI001FED45BA|nr:hypothetical protein [Neisseria sp. HMSC70E02]